LQSVAQLQAERLAAEAQLAQMRRLAPNNPQVGALVERIETMRKAIAAETSKVTGRNSLSAKAPEYDLLVLEKGFSDRQLAMALASLESARGEAARKHLYLERLVQPNLPDEAVEPRRLRAVLTVFVVGLLLWGVVSLVVSSVREHVD
jgi:capsular polysaccharide transport system permease protein